MLTATDPYMNFRFVIEFDHVQWGGFNKVKGISREIKVETYHEGGQNEFEHKFASQAAYGNLTLERGLVSDRLWQLQQEASDGSVTRHDITIVLRDGRMNEVWRWLVDGAFPIKWTASDLDGSSAQVLIESVEFAHRGIRKG